MSEHNHHHGHGDHGHGHDDHGHGHDDHEDVGYHATVKGYLIGFLLSLILTAIPFFLVMTKSIASSQAMGIVLLIFAAVQIVVHMIYFLHMNSKVEGGWSMLSLIFTIAVVVIMLAGSIWVMFHLNSNMMPVHDMRNMP